MTYRATARFRHGRTINKDLDSWSAINAFARELGKDAPVPLFTTLTVEHGGVKKRFSVRGGGGADKSMKLIPLTEQVHPAPIQGGKIDPVVTLRTDAAETGSRNPTPEGR